MAAKKTLEMIFRNENGDQVTLRVPNPKDNLTKAQVDNVMQTIIAKNIFTTRGGDLTQIADAQIRVLDVQTLA